MDFVAGEIIPINKPYTWTSFQIVNKIRYSLSRKYGIKRFKVGHAGTLDPLASGVLLLCTGKATKRIEELQSHTKEYEAEIMLGATTPSFDMEHPVDATYPYEHITREMVEGILPKFIGEQDQIPPVFSAKLIDGTRAYEMARAGEEVVMKPARITIYDMEVLEFELPKLVLRVKCSKGTYIRSIARDMGAALGSGGYLTGLERTLSGGFSVGKCLKMDDLAEIMKK